MSTDIKHLLEKQQTAIKMAKALDIKQLIEALHNEKAPQHLKIGITPPGAPKTDETYGTLYITRQIEAFEIAEALKINTTVQSLEIYHYYASEAGLIALINAVALSKTIKKLRLPFCHILTNETARALAQCLTVNRSLTSLHMNGCTGINDEGAETMAAALSRNTTLTDLRFELCQGRMSERGVYALVAALSSINSLRSLKFPLVLMRAESLVLLKPWLISPTATLKNLDLSGVLYKTEASEAMIQMLAEIICHNTSLLRLDLTDVDLKNDREGRIAKALQKNKTLLALKLHGCIMDEEGRSAFATALEENKTLLKLQLIPDEFSETYKNSEAITKVDALLARNRDLCRRTFSVMDEDAAQKKPSSSIITPGAPGGPSFIVETHLSGSHSPSTEQPESKESKESDEVSKAVATITHSPSLDFAVALRELTRNWQHPRTSEEIKEAREMDGITSHYNSAFRFSTADVLEPAGLSLGVLGAELDNGIEPVPWDTTQREFLSLSQAQQRALLDKMASGSECTHRPHCPQQCVIL